MIVPWQQVAPETLTNLIKEYVLREGTDYGEYEATIDNKIKQVQALLKSGEAVIQYSELHETVDIKLKREL